MTVETQASPLYFKCQQCGCMNSVTFPSMMMLPTVQAVPQESLAPVTKPKPVSKPSPKTYALPAPPKPPQIVAQQGPELLQKDRRSPTEKHSSSLSPRSFARNARSKKESSPAEVEIEDFIILDDDIEDEVSPEENRRQSYEGRRTSEDRRSPEARRYSSDRSSGRKRSSPAPEATTADLYDDLVPIDVDAMPDNAPYETRDSRMEYQEAQMTQTYNVNVDVNDGYTRENSPKDSMPLRLVPSRMQRVGTKRGQPAEQSIENNDAVTGYKPVPSWSPDAKRAKDAETTSSEKEIQNRLPVNPWTGAIIYGATAPPRPQPRPRGPAVNRGAAKPKTSEKKPTRTDSNPNQKKNQVNTVVAEKQVIVTGARVPERKSPKNPPKTTGVVTTNPSPPKKQDRLSQPPDMKAWRQAQENLKTIDYGKQDQSQPKSVTKPNSVSNPSPKPVPKPVKKTAILSKEPDAVKTVTPTQKSIIPTRKAKVTARKAVHSKKPVVTDKGNTTNKSVPVPASPVEQAPTTPTKCALKPKTARKTAPMVSKTTPVKTTATTNSEKSSPKVTKPSPKKTTPKPKKLLPRKTAQVIAASRRERSPTPKRASPEIDDERIYDVDREIPTDALREPEEISSDEGEKNIEEDDPATWCITDDFIDLT